MGQSKKLSNYNYAQHVGQLCRNSNYGDSELYLILDYIEVAGGGQYLYTRVSAVGIAKSSVRFFHNRVEFFTPSGIKEIPEYA